MWYPTPEQVVRILVRLRTKDRMRVKDICSMLNISKTTYYSYMRGHKRRVKDETVKKLVDNWLILK